MLHAEIDAGADQAAQQVRKLGERVRQVQYPRLQCLLTRESEELADQIGGTVRILLDLHDIGERSVARLMPQQQEIAEADHRSEEHTSELQSLMRIQYAVVCS